MFILLLHGEDLLLQLLALLLFVLVFLGGVVFVIREALQKRKARASSQVMKESREDSKA